ncbi:MAG: DUF2326 domain-containing protein [Candidatus Omnitrophota bacterium]
MRLIKVYSNQKSFKIVKFNRSGPSFIVAKQKNPGINEEGKTYNGVGKSLLIRIIHFCLGAQKGDYKTFCEKLPGWEFYLDFELGNKKFTAQRSTDDPGKIILNDDVLSIDNFKKSMEERCFDIPSNISFLSFRSLIPFFIRAKKESYNEYNKPFQAKSDYQTLVNNALLLGLNVGLAEKKYKTKEEKERIKQLEKNFKNDELLKGFLTGDKDVSLTLIDLEERINRLDSDLRNFKVAENYYEVQLEADKIEKELFALSNDLILLKNNIENIDKSLEFSPDINKERIQTIYNESKIHFSENMTRTLNDIENFYERLISNRKRKLLEQKSILELKQQNIQTKIGKLQSQFDSLMKYLGEHQALDVFVNLSTKSSELKSEYNDIKKYQQLQTEYKNKKNQIDKELSELSEIAENYLKEIESDISELRDYFRSLAKVFYPDSVSGLTIESNSRDNQLCFDIKVKIESDASDGINNVKIFCYDLTVLFKGHNHKINFVFHDSRLFDGIDERQKSDIFKIIIQRFSNSNKQYIATVNQNQLDEIKKYLTEEFRIIINQNTVLTLTDESDSEKLLGIKVDIGDK